MSQQGYTSEIVRLIEQQGAARARQAEQNGAIWGGALSSLGQIPAQVQQMDRQKQQLALQKQQGELTGLELQAKKQDMADQQATRTALSDSGGDLEKALPAIMRTNPEAGLKLQDALRKQKQAVMEYHGKIAEHIASAVGPIADAKDPQGQQAAIDLAHSQLQALGIPTDDLPKQAGPQATAVAAAFRKSALGAKEQLAANAAETTAAARAKAADATAAEAEAKLPGIKADTAIKEQVAAGTVGGLTPEQQAQNAARAKTEARTAAQGAERNAIARARLDDARKKSSTDNSEGLVQTVIANPGLFDQLTPTEKGKIAPRLNELGYTGFGKPLAPAAVKQLADSQTAVDSLKELRTTLKENEQYIGPIAGLQAYNPYSPAKAAQAKIDLVRQRVGKALEGGVLRKEDEEKYKQILATMRDTPETAISKIDGLIHSVEMDMENFKNQQRLSGRRVGEAPSGTPAEKKNPFKK